MGAYLDRRDFVKLSGTSAIALLNAYCSQPKKFQQRPNVLLILTDQLATSALGCYGNRITSTPAFDEVAKDGIMLANHYISGFPCSPSRACLITGRYAHNHGVVINDVPLDESIPSLGKIFSDSGYETAWIGKWHLGGNMERQEGEHTVEKGDWYFQRVSEPSDFVFREVQGGTGEDTPMCGFRYWVSGWADFRKFLRISDLPDDIRFSPDVGCHNALASSDDSQHAFSRLGEKHHPDHFLASEMIRFLNGIKTASKPFLAVLSFFGPHHPLAPPKPWDAMYDIQDVSLPPNFQDSLRNKPVGQTNRPEFVRPKWTEYQYKDYIRRYYGFVSFIDYEIGRVLHTLRKYGLEDNTIVIVTSDHGDMVAEHGLIYKLITNGYDTLMKTPVLIRWPRRLEGGRVVNSLASSIDLLPTLLSLTDLNTSNGFDGISLSKTVTGRSDVGRDEIVTDVMNAGVMIRLDHWKYVFNYHDTDELYDLRNDPWEIENLVSDRSQSDTLEWMRQHVFDWFRTYRHPYAENRIRMRLRNIRGAGSR